MSSPLPTIPHIPPTPQWPSVCVPLAQLTPETAAEQPSFIQGVITLLKPYSTSSSTFSLLVCEEDFRLRRSKGQLWLNLRGSTADEVHSKVQIGDRISLSMEGVQLEPLHNPSPGDVPWTAEVSGGIFLKIASSSREDIIRTDVSARLNETAEAAPQESLPSPATPPPRLSLTYSQTSETEWTTPDLFKRGADVLKSPPYVPGWLFGNDDLSDESRPRKKARTFRIVSCTPSPEREIVPQTSVEESEGEGGVGPRPSSVERPPSFTRASRPVGLEMPPPPVPFNDANADSQEHEIPDSPSLQPVQSDTLPLVSPFLHTGFSSADYMGIDQNSSPTIQMPGGREAEAQDTTAAPRTTQTDRTELPAPEPDGAESDKDSLFDPMSDGEGPPRRRKSKSPLPGPSPLRTFERAKSLGAGRVQRPVLSALKTPSNPSTGTDAPLKTPILYLPTPSPKVASEGTQFPFSAPPKADSVPQELKGRTNRKLFRQSTPTNISSYFGHMSRNQAGSSGGETGEQIVSQLPTPGSGDAPGKLSALEETARQRSPPPSFKSGVTTPLSDFPALAFLSWGVTVDVIGVVTRCIGIAQSKAGAKDYYMAVRIADSSQPGGAVMRLFRPYKEALPVVGVGDVIMLRCFKIVSHKHKFIGVSMENSAWAVWTDYGKARPAVCAGPPMEYGEEEEEYVSAIGEWYQSLDPKKREAMELKPLDDLASGVQ